MVDKPQLDEPADGFSSEWLRLREPADHVARSASLTKKLAQWREHHSTFDVVDLGSGTASNLRYLCPKLGMNQSWTLLDNDNTLLSCIADRISEWAIELDIEFLKTTANSASLKHSQFTAEVRWLPCDLANEMDTINFNNAQLVTGSALLDLTSARWIEKLAGVINAQRCASLFVLNYNGNIQWQPEIPLDAQVNNLLNAHQLNDKGFGHALGPSAFEYFIAQLSNASIETENTDWRLGQGATIFQETLLNGWAMASIEQSSAKKIELLDWCAVRSKHLENRESTLQVGHVDILSLPLEKHTS